VSAQSSAYAVTEWRIACSYGASIAVPVVLVLSSRCFMKVEEPTRWAGSMPRPSITPADFAALVHERATSAISDDKGNNGVSDGPDPLAGIQLKHTVPEYLKAFRTLRSTPRPCKHWLGSDWQRRLADKLIEQKKKNPDGVKLQQGAGADSLQQENKPAEPRKPEASKATAGTQAFMDQLATRRREELKKREEKLAADRREQERVARVSGKVLTYMKFLFSFHTDKQFSHTNKHAIMNVTSL
jgi:hypothetical protein